MTIETLHLYFPATCNHQTLYSGDLGDGLSTTNSHIHLIMWSRDVKGQKTMYFLHFYKTYKNQNWHSGDLTLSWRGPTW